MKYPNIAKMREEHELTQVNVAAHLNVLQTTYSKYERGAITPPIDILIKLSDLYGVTIDYLVGRECKGTK